MGKLAIVPNLFLEVLELSRAFDFVDTNGFRKNLLENSLAFGLIKNSYTDSSFLNGKVSQDIDAGGSRTIKIQDLYGIDKDGSFIYLPQVNQLPVLDDGNYYWVRAKYVSTTHEIGATFSIAANGDLTATGADLTKIFRGQPNFATRIKFLNSVGNTLEYDVLNVVDSTHAVLQHPGNAIGAPSSFVPESNLTLAIVGTFTPGVSIPSPDKFPFKFDYATIELVQETTFNTRPAYVQDREFYLARVKVNGSVVNVHDKRTEYWTTKAEYNLEDIDTNPNPLIGVEAVKYNQPYTPLDQNILELAWGMRSSNWSIDASLNKLTITSGNGGKFKGVADFTDHDFDGWRLYAPNGTYRIVLNSIKTGSAINLTLDVLDVDDYSSDGGATTFSATGGFVLCVPNTEEVVIRCQGYSIDPTTVDPDDAGITAEFIESITRELTFPVNTLYARIELVVNRDPYAWYKVDYRYKTHKKETEFTVIPADTIQGYIVEDSFDPMTSDLIIGTPPTYYTYDSLLPAFIRLKMNARAFKRFTRIVDRGDNFEVDNITTLASVTSIPMIAGTSKTYKYITGSFSLTNDVHFDLQSIAVNSAVRDYNIFEIHFNCTALNLAGFKIYFTQDFGTGGAVLLKTIDVGDIYEMMNRDNGIYLKCTYDATIDKWVVWQTYDLGQPGEIKMVPGDPTTYFTGLGVGNVKGWYGWNIFSPLVGRMPIGIGAYTEASGTYTRTFGTTGGFVKHQLVTGEIPAHSHGVTDPGHSHGVTDPGHSHGITDTGHSHSVTDTGHSHGVTDTGHSHRFNFRSHDLGDGGSTFRSIQLDAGNNAYTEVDPGTGGSDAAYTAYIGNHTTGISINSGTTGISVNSATTGISINSAVTSVTVNSGTTGITTNNAGGGGYHENMPPWYALTFAQKQY